MLQNKNYLLLIIFSLIIIIPASLADTRTPINISTRVLQIPFSYNSTVKLDTFGEVDTLLSCPLKDFNKPYECRSGWRVYSSSPRLENNKIVFTSSSPAAYVGGKRLATGEIAPHLSAKKKHYQFDEIPEFDFEYSHSTQAAVLASEPKFSTNSWKSATETINASLYYKDGTRTELPINFELLKSGKLKIALAQKRELRAGVYSLNLTYIKNGIISDYSQEFTWGVLAINTHKSIYLPDEEAEISIGVLDEFGHAVCDADVTLELISPAGELKTLTTASNSIKKSAECSQDSFTYVPDYSAIYKAASTGNYSMKLTATTKDGTYIVNDSFLVQASVPFDVIRKSVTRINPQHIYRTNILVTANQNYAGKITELLPASFKVISEDGKVKQKQSEQEIEWIVNLKAGETTMLSYDFDAPNYWPVIFLTGPLEIGTWKEARQWKIASDAAGQLILFWDTTLGTIPTGWTSLGGGASYKGKLLRGATTAGSSSGSATHTHTYTSASTSTQTANSGYMAGFSGTTSSGAHSHTVTISSGLSGSNEPQFREIDIIQFNGVPAVLPTNIIAIFSSDPGAGWASYSALNEYYLRANSTALGLGGSTNNQHSHTLVVSLAAASNSVLDAAVAQVATTSHTHSVTGPTTNTVTYWQPYINVTLYKTSSEIPITGGIIGLFDAAAPTSWTSLSGVGGAYNGKFLQAFGVYGGTGGGSGHKHSDTNTTSGQSNNNAQKSGPPGTSASTSATHTHTVFIQGISTITEANNYPPYIDVVVAQLADTTSPVTNLESPADQATPSSPVTFNCSATDNIALANITLWGNWSDATWKANQTNTSIKGSSNWTLFSKSIADGFYVWNCKTCDSTNNCAFNATNYSFTISSGPAATAPTCGASNMSSYASVTITEAGYNTYPVQFDIQDANGNSTINNSNVSLTFQLANQPSLVNTTCHFDSAVNSTTNRYDCRIEFPYYTPPGAYTVYVNGSDTSYLSCSDSSDSFTLSTTTSFTSNVTALTFPQIGVTDINTLSDNDPILLNNTGNKNSTNVQVNATDLRGTIDDTYQMGAQNFSVATGAPICAGGTALVNMTPTQITSATLYIGAPTTTNTTEELYVCLTDMLDTLIPQGYSTNYTATNYWIIGLA